MALFVDLVALSNGLHGSVQMDSVALFSWIGWLRHHGIHIKKDIPEELKAFSDQNPRVKITLGATLGTDDRLAEIITERIKETE